MKCKVRNLRNRVPGLDCRPSDITNGRLLPDLVAEMLIALESSFSACLTLAVIFRTGYSYPSGRTPFRVYCNLRGDRGHRAASMQKPLMAADPDANVSCDLTAPIVGVDSTLDETALAAAISDAGYGSEKLAEVQ